MDRVCHFEVPYADKDRAEAFYEKVFGWQFAPAPGDVPYTFVFTAEVDEQYRPKEPGGINGGMYERGGDAATHPLIVIEVESCEQRIKDVEAAGGSTVVGLQQVGDMGIYAQVKDSEGNIIGMWQPLGK